MEGQPNKKEMAVELQELFDADQADRIVLEGKWNDPELNRRRFENDAVRLKRAQEIYDEYEQGKATLGTEERYQLGMLFHHSADPQNYLKARTLADAAGERGKLLSAQAEDRYLLATGKKQRWGTQFNMDKDGHQTQEPIQSDEESGITDEMRIKQHVPPRAKQLAVHLGEEEWNP